MMCHLLRRNAPDNQVQVSQPLSWRRLNKWINGRSPVLRSVYLSTIRTSKFRNKKKSFSKKDNQINSKLTKMMKP